MHVLRVFDYIMCICCIDRYIYVYICLAYEISLGLYYEVLAVRK